MVAKPALTNKLKTGIRLAAESAKGEASVLMVLSAASNTGSIVSVRNLSVMQRSARNTLAKLSAGCRECHAAAVAAGLTLPEQIRAHVGAIAGKIRNLDTVIDRNNTAESFLEQMESSLLEMREIAVAAVSSGYIDESMCSAYQHEVHSSKASFNSIVENAVYGDKKLLDGSHGSMARIEAINSLDLSDAESAERAITAIDEKLAEIQRVHGQLEAIAEHEFSSLQASIVLSQTGLVESESAIRDAEMARQHATLTSELLRENTRAAIVAQGNLITDNVFGLMSR